MTGLSTYSVRKDSTKTPRAKQTNKQTNKKKIYIYITRLQGIRLIDKNQLLPCVSAMNNWNLKLKTE